MEAKFLVELSEYQVATIIDALDLFTRVGTGQLTEVALVRRLWSVASSEESVNYDRSADINTLVNCLEHASSIANVKRLSITSVELHERFKVAFDIQQVVRQRLAFHRRPEGGIQVYFDDPLKIGKEQLCKCSVQFKSDNSGDAGLQGKPVVGSLGNSSSRQEF
jgi:hypothetical protein